MKATIFKEDHQLNLEAIEEILTSFYYATDVPVTLYDQSTQPLGTYFEDKKILPVL